MATNTNKLTTSPNAMRGIGQTFGLDIKEIPTPKESPLITRELCETDFQILPEEARRKVLQELEFAQSLSQENLIVESERRRVIQDRTLQYYCGGSAVACVRSTNSDGVSILAVGEADIGVLVRAVPPDRWKGVVVEFPEPL